LKTPVVEIRFYAEDEVGIVGGDKSERISSFLFPFFFFFAHTYSFIDPAHSPALFRFTRHRADWDKQNINNQYSEDEVKGIVNDLLKDEYNKLAAWAVTTAHATADLMAPLIRTIVKEIVRQEIDLRDDITKEDMRGMHMETLNKINGLATHEGLHSAVKRLHELSLALVMHFDQGMRTLKVSVDKANLTMTTA
jgi:hypothetical protein